MVSCLISTAPEGYLPLILRGLSRIGEGPAQQTSFLTATQFHGKGQPPPSQSRCDHVKPQRVPIPSGTSPHPRALLAVSQVQVYYLFSGGIT
ncbi:hypothetical protein N658DRAFT_269326 [Parathielavia hyrcaniae]|uniref:Uncharacterized protein n=1 Tax=Parathielavia hyrcaniae TaxID=113614 RepID=A0AAN6PTD5_9PEZI|nr:hypothetical protein N658DRAFT_269326 [Parathielavia hyrcaniae]